MKALTGAGVALITPFHEDGTIDFPSLERLIEYQIAQGMDYLVSLGTTGETATLSKTEKSDIIRFTAEKVRGRIPLVIGVGGNHTEQLCEELKTLDLQDFCAVLSVSPYYNKPTQEGIFRHYQRLAAASPLPIILYNVPGRTGSNITAETTTRLASEVPGIVAIKEASGDFGQFSRIMRDKPEEFLLISGDDPVLLPMAALGASGVISVVGNAFPAHLKQLCDSSLNANFKRARKLHSELIEMIDLCFIEGNPAGVKAALLELGIIESDCVRLPLVPVSEAIRTRIKACCEALSGTIH